MTPCSLVDMFRRFVGTSCSHSTIYTDEVGHSFLYNNGKYRVIQEKGEIFLR